MRVKHFRKGNDRICEIARSLGGKKKDQKAKSHLLEDVFLL